MVTAIIPARMQSTRFPGKPLCTIKDKPMVQWTYERTMLASSVEKVFVATCDREIAEAVEAFGGEVVMTKITHQSGTDRLAEAAEKLETDIVVNVQADEPLIDPKSIDLAVQAFSDKSVEMTSLMVEISELEAADPNIVKVVCDCAGNALYFSRSSIPHARDTRVERLFGHVGLYAYTKKFLLEYSSWPATPLEKTESLEQLRVLEHGRKIKMMETQCRPVGVDTPEDLERVRRLVG